MHFNKEERNFIAMSMNDYTEETICDVLNLTESEYDELYNRCKDKIKELEERDV